METKSLTEFYIRELQAESASARKCLERIPESLYDFKPHPKSMAMGYLTLLVAEIPKWLTLMIRDSVVDFATYEHFQLSTQQAMLAHFEENLAEAMQTLNTATEQQLNIPFELRNNGQVLLSAPKTDYLGITINHWVHHRGQLTVYMRLNDIAVPSLYGPSADERTY